MRQIFQKSKVIPKFPQDQQEIATDQERRRLFLRYVNRGWLIFGIITLLSLPFFPGQHSEFIYLLAVTFPTYLVIRILNLSGRTQLAGMIFTFIVNFGFYGLFLVLARELGAEEAFRSQATVWMLMGIAVLFAGAFVDKRVAPVVALVNTALLIVTRLTLAPDADPRPSALVFWWMMAVIIWLYEGTLQKALARAWNEVAERKRANEQLRKLSNAVEHSPASIVITDPEGTIEYVNPRFTNITGYVFDEVIGKNPRILQSGLTPKEEYPRLWNTIKAGKDWHGEFCNKTKNGELYWESAYISPIKDEAGNITHFVAVNENITERKQAEETLIESEGRFRSLSEAAFEGIMIHDRGIIVNANQAFANLFGYSSDKDLIGKNGLEILPFALESRELIRANLSSGATDPVEIMIMKPDGAMSPAETQGRDITIKGRKFRVVAVRDITKRKSAQEALRKSEAKFRAVVENSNDGILFGDANAKISYRSPSYIRINGFADEERIGHSGFETVHPDDLEMLQQYWAQVVQHPGEPLKAEYRIRHKNGTWRYVETTSQNLLNNPDIQEIIVTSHDITERKQAEQRIERRNRELEALQATILDISSPRPLSELLEIIVERACILLDTTSGGLYLCDDERQEARCVVSYNTVSDFTGTILKYGEGAAGLVAQTGEPLMIEDYKAWAGRAEVFASGPSFERVMSVPMKWEGKVTGVIHALRAKETPFKDDDLELLTLFANHAALAVEQARLRETLERQLREIKQAEEALSESRARLAGIIDSAMDAIVTIDSEQHIVLFNAAAEKMFGCSADEIMGQSIDRFIPMQFRDIHREQIRRFGQSGITNRTIGMLNTLSGIRSDGNEFPAEISISQGDVSGRKIYTAIVRDVTERKRAEEKIQRQLQRLNALRMIDMAISSSFDLHIVLAVVLQYAISQLEVDASAILLVNPHQQTIEYAASRGFRSNAIQHTRLRIGEGFAGRAVLERRTIHVSNLMETGGKLATALHLGNEAFVDYYGVPLLVKGEIKGVLEVYHRSPLNPDPDRLEFLETLAGQAAIAIDNAQLFSSLQHSNLELELAHTATIEGWSKAMDMRDKETEGHTLRVTELTLHLARAMGIPDAELIHIRRGGMLHDIGKMGVPDNILLKSNKLTDEEWAVMRKHPQFAYEMLTEIHYLKPALDIPYCHHEKWDGTGYPRGLKGEEIPIAARIFAVADVWDAITTDRPYRKGWSKENALEYIREQSGKYFDPQVVEVFLRIIVSIVPSIPSEH